MKNFYTPLCSEHRGILLLTSRQNLPLILARFHNLFIISTLTHSARMTCTVPQAVKPCQTHIYTCGAFIGSYRQFYRYIHNNPHRAKLQAEKGGFTPPFLFSYMSPLCNFRINPNQNLCFRLFPF